MCLSYVAVFGGAVAGVAVDFSPSFSFSPSLGLSAGALGPVGEDDAVPGADTPSPPLAASPSFFFLLFHFALFSFWFFPFFSHERIN